MDSVHTSRSLDDSSEDEAGNQVVPVAIHREQDFLDESTTTSTTTTTITMAKHTVSSKKTVESQDLSGYQNLVDQHQSVHSQQLHLATSSSSHPDDAQTDSENTGPHPPAVPHLQGDGVRTERTTITSIQAPSHSSSSSAGAAHLLGSQGQVGKDNRVVDQEFTSRSSSSSSLASSIPGTPSSANGVFRTVTTTSTVTTKKRKVRRPTFEARSSRLDPEAMSESKDPFRGFHTLFWIVMGAYGVITFNEEWTKVGKAFGGTLFSSFSQDAIGLAFSDMGLILATFVAYFLSKVISKGWIRYKITGMVIQHCVQLIFLLFAIVWTIWKDWPWVQSGFFTLHAITMLMKIHSYISYNGELSEKLIQLKKAEASYALIKKNDIETLDDDSDDAQSSITNSTGHSSNSDTNSDSDAAESDRPASRHLSSASESGPVKARQLSAEIEELRGELGCQNGELWPANITIANYVDYLIVPSLIYELQYPRTSRIRPLYVLEKTIATFGTFILLYLTTEHYIYPVVFDPSISPLRALVMLLIPFMMNYLMIFYIIFECICNAFAELSRFADRSFYEDWWNCVSFDEWARKWNKPVHHFLLRHVYDSSIESFHLSKPNAALATFFLSSCVHELVMMV
ncbi:hypothetical protein BGW38_002529, partial [Lunasporangiospora selenospora]